MEKNIGLIDRLIRSSVAIAMVVAFWTGHLKGYDGLFIRLIGVYLILTAFFAHSPLYSLLKFSTIKNKKEKDEK